MYFGIAAFSRKTFPHSLNGAKLSAYERETPERRVRSGVVSG
jgi:hypothetical protein